MTTKALALYFIILLGFPLVSEAQITHASCPESASYFSKDSINIVTFGASTVEGVNGLDFQSHLKKNFSNCYLKQSINIQKNAVGGETTGMGLLRIDKAIAGKTGFIVILIGANDAVQIEARKQTIEETEANMRKLITKSLNQKLIPILCTIQNFDDRTDRLYRRINYQIRLINNLYKKLAIEYNIDLADLNAALGKDFSLYQDLVHPNNRGNRLISLVLFDTINKIIANRFLEFTVSQNYPNPGKNTTKVDIIMPAADKVQFNIYNIQGKLVQNILNEYLNTGKHTITLDISALPNGIYIYKVNTTSGLYKTSKKLMVMH